MAAVRICRRASAEVPAACMRRPDRLDPGGFSLHSATFWRPASIRCSDRSPFELANIACQDRQSVGSSSLGNLKVIPADGCPLSSQVGRDLAEQFSRFPRKGH